MSETKKFQDVIEMTVENHIATIVINSPGNENMLAPYVTNGLCEAITEANFDNDVRVIVLRSALEDVFLGPGDGAVITPVMMKNHLAARQKMLEAYNVQRAMIYGAKPIIAAVDGLAKGGGCGVTLASDIVFCTERSVFDETVFTMCCMPPDSGGLWHLQHLVGPMKAKYIALKDTPLTAQEALEVGLCVKVLPDAETLYKEVYAYAASVAARSPVGVFATKQMSNRLPEINFETYLLLESEFIANSINSHDFKALIQSLADGNAPAYEGY